MGLKTGQLVALDYLVQFEYLAVFLATELFPVSDLLVLLLLFLHPCLRIFGLSLTFVTHVRLISKRLLTCKETERLVGGRESERNGPDIKTGEETRMERQRSHVLSPKVPDRFSERKVHG